MVPEVGHLSMNQIDINHSKWLKQNGASYCEAVTNSERPVFCELLYMLEPNQAAV